ncbi:MAG: hypothetical protein RLY64_485 [Bacteroidota bacterium]
MKKIFFFAMAFVGVVFGQERSKFKQLEEEWPTPSSTRNASGAPGANYWQQKVDYHIQVRINEAQLMLEGKETITYHNNSPDRLTYLWLQLDQNIYRNANTSTQMRNGTLDNKNDVGNLKRMAKPSFEGGCDILSVTDASGKKLKYTVNETMMRVDLPIGLASKGDFTFQIAWKHKLNDARFAGGRGAIEFFESDSNYIFEMAQWFPRLCVYSDNVGWQHKQFLGSGEFTLNFGDYKVEITVPSDHIVVATGELRNASSVLTATQQKRLEAARVADRPTLIVTEEEAKANIQDGRSTAEKTWVFEAKNVRDFAFASSRRYIWDGMGVKLGSRNVLCMSAYPPEANPLWGKYSTEAVAHTVRIYSKFTIDYPYPVAISANGPVGGMEYPMISFNGARPDKDGTYSERRKYGLISVIIHEVGHNFFPMIINSDERQWTWMDEGLNTFVQYLAEQEWDRNYPSSRGPARNLTDYMRSPKNMQSPIMMNSESLLQFGNNAYGKPATALNILRETVMGRELFDFAFKEYCRRWAFKHPSPSDFFRTMEDASAVDLDWFWHGWFYTTDRVDVDLTSVKHLALSDQSPAAEKGFKKSEKDGQPIDISKERNKKDIEKAYVELKPELLDFYNSYDPLKVTAEDEKKYSNFVNGLSEEDKKFLKSSMHYYQLTFENVGGLVTPLIVELQYEDGTKEIRRFPVEVWLKNENKCNKVLVTEKPVKRFVFDPLLETCDTDTDNNAFPRILETEHFEIMKYDPPMNPMKGK